MAEFIIYYAIGALSWTLVLGLIGADLTPSNLIGVILWPIALIHFLGLLISLPFRRR